VWHGRSCRILGIRVVQRGPLSKNGESNEWFVVTRGVSLQSSSAFACLLFMDSSASARQGSTEHKLAQQGSTGEGLTNPRTGSASWPTAQLHLPAAKETWGVSSMCATLPRDGRVDQAHGTGWNGMRVNTEECAAGFAYLADDMDGRTRLPRFSISMSGRCRTRHSSHGQFDDVTECLCVLKCVREPLYGAAHPGLGTI